MTTHHTPGPWLFAGLKADRFALQKVYAENPKRIIAVLRSPLGENHIKELTANARLIALSPRMLDALRKVERQLAEEVDRRDDEDELYEAPMRPVWDEVQAILEEYDNA